MPPVMDRTCSKTGCKNKISSQNKTGVCTPCQQGYPVGSDGWKPAAKKSAGSSKPDADDAMLERVETSSVKPPPPAKAKKPKAPEGPPAEIEEFFKLTEALGLDGQKMLDDWCRHWVAKVRARALGGKPSEDAAPELQPESPQAEATEP